MLRRMKSFCSHHVYSTKCMDTDGASIVLLHDDHAADVKMGAPMHDPSPRMLQQHEQQPIGVINNPEV